MKNFKLLALCLFSCLLLGCYGQRSCPSAAPGANTAGGAVLGGALGAGSGAVIGHQLGYRGEGALIGAAFGLVSGILSGYAHDASAAELNRQRAALASIRAQNNSNYNELLMLQAKLDRAVSRSVLRADPFHTLYFDTDASSLRAGHVTALEMIAEEMKRDPGVRTIYVRGHTDDAHDKDYNVRLSEARARAVRAQLGALGLGMDRIVIEAIGSEEPVASNATPEGRQLNRRVEIFVSSSY